MTLPRPPVS